MTTLNLGIPYIYAVKNGNLQHFSTAPMWMKILSIITSIATLFYAFHLVIKMGFDDQVVRSVWVDEVHFYIACFFPGFLLLSGTFPERKRLNRVAWMASLVYAVCLGLNIPNSHELIEIYHLQYPTSIALLTMLTVAVIHFVKKQRNVSDVLKLLWLFSFTYLYVVPKFVPKYHQAGWFLVAMQCLFPVVMAIGLIQFYRNPKKANV